MSGLVRRLDRLATVCQRSISQASGPAIDFSPLSPEEQYRLDELLAAVAPLPGHPPRPPWSADEHRELRGYLDRLGVDLAGVEI